MILKDKDMATKNIKKSIFDRAMQDTVIAEEFQKKYNNNFRPEIFNVITQSLNIKSHHQIKNKEDSIKIYTPYFQYSKREIAPILKIENTELLNMLLDTDSFTSQIKNARLPYDDFILFFKHKGFDIELSVNKVPYVERLIKNSTGILKEGDYFHAINGYLYKKGGKNIITIGEINFTTISTNMNITLDTEDRDINNVYKITRNLLTYLMTQKAKNYIKTKRRDISKTIKINNSAKNKRSIATPLFNDVQYAYNGSSYSKASIGGKRPHLRAGHFRTQPYGSRDSDFIEYKSIWIEPTFVNKIDKEKIIQKIKVVK